MVEKKNSKVTKKVTKKTASKSVKKNPKKAPVNVAKKVEQVKTVVKEMPVKKSDSCTGNSCCDKKSKCLTVVILVLLLVNIVLTGITLCQKLSYNQDKYAEIGGVENYEIFEKLNHHEKAIEQKSQMIDQYISNLDK